jgi:hypothetical protein
MLTIRKGVMNIEEAPTILLHCHYQEDATHSYDVMRGGFVWKDEMPDQDRDRKGFVQAIFLLSKVIAYRASLTLGDPRAEYADEWNALKRLVPSWPEFREERIYGRIERELRIVKRREEQCLERLEREFEDEEE